MLRLRGPGRQLFIFIQKNILSNELCTRCSETAPEEKSGENWNSNIWFSQKTKPLYFIASPPPSPSPLAHDSQMMNVIMGGGVDFTNGREKKNPDCSVKKETM